MPRHLSDEVATLDTNSASSLLPSHIAACSWQGPSFQHPEHPLMPAQGRGGCVCLALHDSRMPVASSVCDHEFPGWHESQVYQSPNPNSPLATSQESAETCSLAPCHHWYLILHLAPSLGPALKKFQGNESRGKGSIYPFETMVQAHGTSEFSSQTVVPAAKAWAGLLPDSPLRGKRPGRKA